MASGNSSQKSSLLENITRYGIDSRIGKALLSVKGTNIRIGERVSSKYGHSPAILDYRYYEKGDPIKDIDWKLSARTEQLFVKLREGYRQTDFVIAVDGSGSMRTSYNGNVSKFTTALTLAYIIGRAGLKSRDRVFLWYAGQKMQSDNESSLLSLLMEIESDQAADNFWDITVESSANTFILSDFFVETDILYAFLKHILKRASILLMLSIHDNFEQVLDFKGRHKFLDPESDDSILAESRNINVSYRHIYNKHYQEISRIGKSFGANTVKVMTSEDPYSAFIRAVS